MIPCLLLHKGGLYKTEKFKKPTYIGDPINAIKIFNEKLVKTLLKNMVAVPIVKNEVEMDFFKTLLNANNTKPHFLLKLKLLLWFFLIKFKLFYLCD